METITTTVRKWGNSLGVRLPVEIIKKNDIKPNEEIVIQIGKTKFTTVGDLFKMKIPPFKESTEKLMKDIDKALDF